MTTGHAVEYLPFVGKGHRLYRQQYTRVPYLRCWALVGRAFASTVSATIGCAGRPSEA